MVEDADGYRSLYGMGDAVLRESRLDEWTGSKSSISGCGASDRVQKQINPRLTNLSRMDGAVVDESDGGGKSGLLDKQLLSGEAADTHTHTHTGRSLGRVVDVDAQRSEVLGRTESLGERYLTYWLWKCRKNLREWGVHPMTGENPEADTYYDDTIRE